MPDPIVTGSPEWWRDRLVAQLLDRRLKVKRLEDYYNGKHPLPSPPGRLKPGVLAQARAAYRNLTELGVTNWVKLVADAPAERLEVTGFRFGAPGSTQEADQEAWGIWQANELDADSVLVHDNALQTGNACVLVWPDGDGGVEITGEHSSQMIVAYQAGSRRRRAAALKLWEDDSGRWFATLYLPGEIWKWQTQGSRPLYSQANGDLTWVDRLVPGEDRPVKHPYGVPVVELRANPSLRPAPFGGGRGEFETVIAIQDRINKTIFDRLVTAEFQAFRQRWAIGWSPEIDEKTGLPNQDQVFKASQSFLWTFQGDPDEVKVGEFGQADFSQFIKATESDVNAMAAISKTPPHYLLGAMVNISGDALTAAESGLTAKTKKHARQFGEAWEEVIRLALRIKDDPRAGDETSQIIWGDIEHRTWGEQVDAVLKMQALGVPQHELWAMLPDSSSQQVARWKAMQEIEALTRPANPGPVAPVPSGSGSAPAEMPA